MRKLLIGYIFILYATVGVSQSITVSTESSFLSALSNSSYKTILLNPGTYRFNQTVTIYGGKTVRPVTPGVNANVYFSGTVGGSAFLIKVSNGSTLQGIYFKDIIVDSSVQSTPAIVTVDSSTLQDCVFDGRSYNRIDPTGFTGEFVVATHGAKIYYNTFYDMKNGMLLYLDTWHIEKLSTTAQTNAYNQLQTYYVTPTDYYKSGLFDTRLTSFEIGGCHVKGNFFYNPYYYSRTGVPKLGNGKAAIKTGNGEICYGYHLIENNLFYDCSGEAEIIEQKGKRVLIRNNTFYKCNGHLSLRHGSNSVVYSNYFLEGKGGVMTWGYNHQVLNNYFYKIDSPILTNSGFINNTFDKSMFITYVATASNLFSNNTLVECGPIGINYALNVWNDGRVVGDSDLKFANNFIYQTANNSVIKNTGGTTNDVRAAISLFKSNLLTTTDTLASTLLSATEDAVFKTAQTIPMTPITFGEYQLSFPTIPTAIYQKSTVIPDKINTIYGYNNLYTGVWPNQDTILLKDMNGYSRNAAYKGIGALVGVPSVADLSNSTSRLLRPSDLSGGFLGASMKLVDLPAPACYVTPDGTGTGSSWQDACSLETPATIPLAGFNVYVKSGIYNLTTPFTTAASLNYYGGFKGDELSPSDRRLTDLDGNGIVEPWEFQYPTVLRSALNNSSVTDSTAFIVKNSGYCFDGFTLTHIGSATSTGILRTIAVSAANVKFSNNTIKNSAVTTSWSTTGSGAYSVFFSSLGMINNCLFEKNSLTFNATVDTPTYPFIDINGAANSVFSNNIVRNNIVTANWGTLTTNSGLRSMLLAVVPGTAGLIPTLKNCILHNNELNYSCFTPGITTSSVGATVQMHYGGTTSAIVSDSIYNCTIANNKATNIINAGLRFTQNTYTAHYAANNVCWNNKSVINSVTSVANIAQSATLTAPSLLSNNFSNGAGLANSGTVVVNVNTALASTNTGTNAPLFKSPTSYVGEAWTSSDSSSIKQSNWTLLTGSYLIAKGIAITGNPSDKAGNVFAASPSIGAYEYENINAVVTNIQDAAFPVLIKPGAIEMKVDAEISIFNMLGMEVFIDKLKKGDTVTLPSGIYIACIKTSVCRYSNKIVI
ncbi:MAG: chondroitinase-B domain-containing protein [Paludibacter sp.]